MSYVDPLYASRKNEDRGLTSVKFAIESEQRKISFYVHHSDDPYIKSIAIDYQIYEEHGKECKQVNNLEHLQTWKNSLSLFMSNKFLIKFVLNHSGYVYPFLK